MVSAKRYRRMSYVLTAIIVCAVAFVCPKKFSNPGSSISYLHSRKHGVHLPPKSDAYAQWPLGTLARDWVRYNAEWHRWKPAPMYFMGDIEVSSGNSTIKIIKDSVAWGCWVRPLTMVDFEFIAAVQSDESAIDYIGDPTMFVDWYGPGFVPKSGQNHPDARERASDRIGR